MQRQVQRTKSENPDNAAVAFPKQQERNRQVPYTTKYARNAIAAHLNGDMGERNRICEEGIKKINELLEYKERLPNGHASFNIRASSYEDMAELHEIKEDREAAAACRREAAISRSHFIMAVKIIRR